MTSEDFDGIVIGSGQHGLILASYLARAGQRILLLERRMLYGGGLMTDERTLPGFYHNLHSINHFSISGTPWFRDLGLAARVRYITPRYEFAQPHRDGTALIFSRHIDETAASIARFSPKDADTFREWNAKAERMTREIFMVERYGEPLSQADRASVLGASAIGREFLDLTRRQPIDAVDELFTEERVKVLFLFKLSLFGTVLKETLSDHSPVGSLIRAFDLTTGYELCQGGSWNLARGLMETFIAAGGVFVNQAHVERIDVEGGRARGVTLADGRRFTARSFVASTVDVHQTFDEMVDRRELPPAYQAKLDRFHYTTWALYGLHLALDRPPAYTAEHFDPHVGQALKYNIGSETVADLITAHGEVEAGRLPSRVQFGAGALSVLDPSQAPPGHHTAYAWHVVPHEIDGSPQRVDQIRGQLADSILDRWAQYAPNMSARSANILRRYTYTSYDYTRELINMRSGDIFMGALSADQVMYNHFGYSTPIDGLYYAGSAAHPNGAITGGAGYIAAGVIARDLGLARWWTPVDPRPVLARLA